uniref:Uncharacterized protein n=1 Tax=Tanacetum cinerariifolium TaxID=118510 RepID=A0A6L2N719_TANCI|nr:hypothetical protein [Tanacetum cinerariifolium]
MFFWLDDIRFVDGVLDGAFRGVGDEEVVVGEGIEEEALVEFMVEWFEEDEDGKRNGKDDYLIRKHMIKVEKYED